MSALLGVKEMHSTMATDTHTHTEKEGEITLLCYNIPSNLCCCLKRDQVISNRQVIVCGIHSETSSTNLSLSSTYSSGKEIIFFRIFSSEIII